MERIPPKYLAYGFAAFGTLCLAVAIASFAVTEKLLNGEFSGEPKTHTVSITSPVVPELTWHEFASAHTGHLNPLYTEYTVPEDMWIVGNAGELKNAPNNALHHSHLYIKGQQPDQCYADTLIAGRSSMTNADPFITRVTYPSGYGIFLKKSTVLLQETIFDLSSAEPLSPEERSNIYKDVSFILNLDVVYAEDAPPGLKPFTLYFRYLGDQGCDGIFRVSAHTIGYTRRSEDRPVPTAKVVFPSDGAIVMLHMHYHPWAGGKSLTVYLNGKEVYESKPAKINSITYGEQWVSPKISGNPWLWRVKKGDRLTYSVRYDNPSATPVTDAMGTVYVYFSPDQSGQ